MLQTQQPLLFKNIDLVLLWQTISEYIRPSFPKTSAKRLDSCVPVAWDETTHTLAIEALDPEWLNQRAARMVSRCMIGILNVGDPKVVFMGRQNQQAPVSAPPRATYQRQYPSE